LVGVSIIVGISFVVGVAVGVFILVRLICCSPPGVSLIILIRTPVAPLLLRVGVSRIVVVSTVAVILRICNRLESDRSVFTSFGALLLVDGV